jgi:hypothetical protein
MLGAISSMAGVGRGLASADGELSRLITEHYRFDKAIQMAEDEVDALLIADRRLGRKRGMAAEDACGRAESLHEAQGRVANAIVNTPAATLVGAAYKLIVWRRQASISFPDDFDGAHESFTFSAYRDLLRLTGLEALAHPHDPATLARMRRYWILS